MNHKKLLLVSALCAAGALTACQGSNTASTTAASSAPAETEAESTAAAETGAAETTAAAEEAIPAISVAEIYADNDLEDLWINHTSLTVTSQTTNEQKEVVETGTAVLSLDSDGLVTLAARYEYPQEGYEAEVLAFQNDGLITYHYSNGDEPICIACHPDAYIAELQSRTYLPVRGTFRYSGEVTTEDGEGLVTTADFSGLGQVSFRTDADSGELQEITYLYSDGTEIFYTLTYDDPAELETAEPSSDTCELSINFLPGTDAEETYTYPVEKGVILTISGLDGLTMYSDEACTESLQPFVISKDVTVYAAQGRNEEDFFAQAPFLSDEALYADFISQLEEGQGYAFAEMGLPQDVILVSSGIYTADGDEYSAIEATVYGLNDKDEIMEYGTLASRSTAYPLAARNGFVYSGSHHSMERYTIDAETGKLVLAACASESFTQEGDSFKPTYYYFSSEEHLDGEQPDDSRMAKMIEEYMSLKPLNFYPVGSPVDYSAYVGKSFSGKDPWGEDMTVSVTDISGNTLSWTLTEAVNGGEEKIEAEFTDTLMKGNVGTFLLEDSLENDLCSYSGTIRLTDQAVVITYVDGALETQSENGNSSWHMAGAVPEADREIVLK